jgi:Alpha/beta hydrolase family
MPSTARVTHWYYCTAAWWTTGSSSRTSALSPIGTTSTPRNDAGTGIPGRARAHHEPADGRRHDRVPRSGVREPADLVGHSDGAFVAMLVAMQRPEVVKRLVLISGGFNKSGEAMPDMEWNVDQLAEFLGPAYGEVSPDGEEHFKVVATKIGEMAAIEPNLHASDLGKVTARILVMFSDDDLMTMTHVVEMYDALPNAELAVVPGTSHFLTQEKPHLVNQLVLDFLTNDPSANGGTELRGQSFGSRASSRCSLPDPRARLPWQR